MSHERSPPHAPPDDAEPPSAAKRAWMIREWNKGSLRIVKDAQDNVSEPEAARGEDDQHGA